ncbi:GtrA family protein [uncultured Thiodictyon sp.]|uniref:GtrA family protein n=1 Tax=uncultured Thiodictyon sp. TaxID=1846217 RepID=UPI0025EDB00D|nr:GtrA family protein [uncultured Thiodictyon sp.]
MNPFAQLAGQLTRFGLVGVFNTGVDFAITNALFLLLRPVGDLGLLTISAIACAVAAVNSYWMNSRWTFQQGAGEDRSVTGFALVAALGLVVNSATFLFLVKYLHLLVETGPVLTINLAKLGGVGAAMVVTFLGYRLGVFRTEGTRTFRQLTRLEPADGPPRWHWLGGMILLALLVRLGFLALAPVAYGDAISYSWVAWFTAHGEFAQVDTFWHSLFDFWQALLIVAGLERYPALVVSSLIPGLLLVLPVYLIGRRLYGETAGLIAGLLIALHPRLVEYSVNGYPESFYLLAAAWGIWGLTALYQGHRGWASVLAIGCGLGGYFLVRNEGMLLLALLLGTAFYQVGRRDPRARRALLFSAAIIAAMTIGYVGATQSFWGSSGLFAKSSDLAKQHLETLDIGTAARETYGGGERPVTAAGWSAQFPNLLERWPRNLRYAAERLPGVLLSPVVLFALALPLLVARRGGARHAEMPLLLFTVWPLAFYPLLQLEPRLLFPTLIGACLFGAAGVVAGGRFLAHELAARPRLAAATTSALATAILVLLLPLTPLLAWNSESERGYHRAVGHWIAEHLSPDLKIAGDGYGYVSASTFWAGRKGEPRRWTETPEELATWAREHDFTVLICYEDYLRQANPQLLATLDQGFPGMTQLHQFEFPRVGRVTLWGSASATPEALKP